MVIYGNSVASVCFTELWIGGTMQRRNDKNIELAVEISQETDDRHLLERLGPGDPRSQDERLLRSCLW
jgi:hypothetical protein